MKIKVYGEKTQYQLELDKRPCIDSFLSEIKDANLKREYEKDVLTLELVMENMRSILPHKKGRPINRTYKLIGENHYTQFLDEMKIAEIKDIIGQKILIYDDVNFPKSPGYIRGIKTLNNNHLGTSLNGSKP
jgi:hypothetical protein